jgi:hypothetical protein
MAIEYGQIYNSGNLVSGQYPIEKTTAKRTIGWIIESATIDERMEIVAGIGGMFNSYYNVLSQNPLGAIPDYPHMASAKLGLGVDPTLAYTKDDLAWAITAQKSIGKNFTIIGKAARDHLTLLNAGQGFGTDLQHDILPDNKGWYWVLHFQVAI